MLSALMGVETESGKLAKDVDLRREKVTIDEYIWWHLIGYALRQHQMVADSMGHGHRKSFRTVRIPATMY
jgi:hypothetical protein